MISIHSNKCGITATFPATRNTVMFQLCFSFWTWNKSVKGPSFFILYPKNVELISLAGYFHLTY